MDVDNKKKKKKSHSCFQRVTKFKTREKATNLSICMHASDISPLTLHFSNESTIHKSRNHCKECDIEHTYLFRLLKLSVLLHTKRPSECIFRTLST